MADNSRVTTLAPASDSPTALDSSAQAAAQTSTDQDAIEAELAPVVLPKPAVVHLVVPSSPATDVGPISADQLTVELGITTAMSESTTPTAGQADLPQSLVFEPADIEATLPVDPETDVISSESLPQSTSQPSPPNLRSAAVQEILEKQYALREKYDDEEEEDKIKGVVNIEMGELEESQGLQAYKVFRDEFQHVLDDDEQEAILEKHPIAFTRQIKTIMADAQSYGLDAGTYYLPDLDILKFGGFPVLERFLALSAVDNKDLDDLEVAYIAIHIPDPEQTELTAEDIKILGDLIKACRHLYWVYLEIPNGSLENAASILESATLALKILEETMTKEYDELEENGEDVLCPEIPKLYCGIEWDFAVEHMGFDGRCDVW